MSQNLDLFPDHTAQKAHSHQLVMHIPIQGELLSIIPLIVMQTYIHLTFNAFPNKLDNKDSPEQGQINCFFYLYFSDVYCMNTVDICRYI